MQRVVARVGRAHGLRGEVSIEVRTDVPEERFVPGATFATDPADAGPLTLDTRARPQRRAAAAVRLRARPHRRRGAARRAAAGRRRGLRRAGRLVRARARRPARRGPRGSACSARSCGWTPAPRRTCSSCARWPAPRCSCRSWRPSCPRSTSPAGASSSTRPAGCSTRPRTTSRRGRLMRVDVVTIFPAYLDALQLSLIGKAREQGLLDVAVHDLRDFTHDRHRTVDDTPYGGGPGMVMRPEPWGEALDHVEQAGRAALGDDAATPAPARAQPVRRAVHPGDGARAGGASRGWPSPAAATRGSTSGCWTTPPARWRVTPVSLGDYVLNGGEVAVLAIVEAVGAAAARRRRQRREPGGGEPRGRPARVPRVHQAGVLARARGAARAAVGPPRGRRPLAARRAAAPHRAAAAGPARRARPGHALDARRAARSLDGFQGEPPAVAD